MLFFLAIENKKSAFILLFCVFLVGCYKNPSVPKHVKQLTLSTNDPGILQKQENQNMLVPQLNFWSTLTPFEQEVLQEIEKARRGDPEILLALSLIGSGQAITRKQFETYQKKVKWFVEQMKPRLEKIKKSSQKGNALHKAMHRHFLAGKGKDLSGYEYQQTELTELLETGKYNCMSSSLLFMVLSRHFDWQVQGVELPSHVFLQLTFPEHPKPFEVETTSYTGFDWIHDSQYYQNSNNQWLNTRNLQTATYQDYLQRKIIDPHVLVSTLMGNFMDRLSEKDQKRMKEMRAFVDPENRDYQLSRLRVYSQEYRTLYKNKNFKSLLQMFETIHSLFPQIETRWAKDPEILSMLALLKWEYARVLDEMGDPRAIKWIRNSLTTLSKDSPHYQDLLERNLILWRIQIQRMIEKKEFQKAKKQVAFFFKDFSNLLSQQDQTLLKKSVAALYEEWGSTYFEKKHWKQAIARYHHALKWASEVEDQQRVAFNISAAFHNWSIVHTNEAEWSKACQVLKKCISYLNRYPNSAMYCEKRFSKLTMAHQTCH